jgi:hypothetical protein
VEPTCIAGWRWRSSLNNPAAAERASALTSVVKACASVAGREGDRRGQASEFWGSLVMLSLANTVTPSTATGGATMTKNGLDENYPAKITTIDFVVRYFPNQTIEYADKDVRFSSRTQVRDPSKPALPRPFGMWVVSS